MHDSICIGIRTLRPDLNCQAILDAKAGGLNNIHIIFETSAGCMGDITNRLLDKMMRCNTTFYLIVDDDIGFSKDTFDKAASMIEKCDAVSVMPIPTDPKLEAYYTQMYSRYEKMDAEPFTFSFALLSRFVVENTRVPKGVDSREEHAFYKEMERLGFNHHTLFGTYVKHLGKTAAIDARHNRWYAAGMAEQEKSYKMSTIFDLLTSPIEGLFYSILTTSFFGFCHTINLRWNSAIGAWFGYTRS